MASQRQQRVARQILHEISAIVGRDASDPRLVGVTFTEVRITPDLRSAHVFFSCLGGQAERKRCAEGLEHATGMMRRELGRRLTLRFVPALRFEFDDSLERAERIARLLRERQPPAGEAGADDDANADATADDDDDDLGAGGVADNAKNGDDSDG